MLKVSHDPRALHLPRNGADAGRSVHQSGQVLWVFRDEARTLLHTMRIRISLSPLLGDVLNEQPRDVSPAPTCPGGAP